MPQAVCSRCGDALEPVNPRKGRNRKAQMRVDDFPQYKDALVIDFEGGFGMYLDPLVHENPTIILDSKCADRFAIDNSWLMGILRRDPMEAVV